jgi:hypothetical protein
VVAVLARPAEIFATRAAEIFVSFLPPVRRLGQQPLEQFCSNTRREVRSMPTEKPDIVTQKHLEYLDGLRESGVTNMFGAGVYIQEAFGVTQQEALQILKYWMKTFDERGGRDNVKQNPNEAG